MQKLVKQKVEDAKLEATFRKLIVQEEIYKFLEEKNIPITKAIQYFSEFELYQNNPQMYELIYELDQVIIKEKKENANEGLTYLDEPYFFENKTLDNIDYKSNPTKAKVVKDFLENMNRGLYLVSSNGVGKTTLIVALANYKYKLTNKKTLFVFWPDFIEKTKRFKEDNVYFINKVKTAPSLIIDDLGQESISVWSRDDILHPIITYRLEKKLPTYITSNYLEKELQDIYTFRSVESKKTRSIIAKLTTLTNIYYMQGQDLRKVKNKN